MTPALYRMLRRPVSSQLLLAPNLLLSLTELVAEQRRRLRGKDNTPEQKSGFRRVTALLPVRDFGDWTDQFLSCLIERGFDPVLFVDTIAFELIAAISLFSLAQPRNQLFPTFVAYTLSPPQITSFNLQSREKVLVRGSEKLLPALA